MCPEEGGEAGLGELRSWWEVPAIAHFCSLFRTAFRLPDFEIEVSGRARRPLAVPRAGGPAGIPRGGSGAGDAAGRRPPGGARAGGRGGAERPEGCSPGSGRCRRPRAPHARPGQAQRSSLLWERDRRSSGCSGAPSWGGASREAAAMAGRDAGEAPPRRGAPRAHSGAGDAGPARDCGAAEGKFRAPRLFDSALPSARPALSPRGPREPSPCLSPLCPRAVAEEEDGSGQAEGARTPRLCDRRPEPAAAAAGLAAQCGDGGGAGSPERAAGPPHPFILGRGCEIRDWSAD